MMTDSRIRRILVELYLFVLEQILLCYLRRAEHFVMVACPVLVKIFFAHSFPAVIERKHPDSILAN